MKLHLDQDAFRVLIEQISEKTGYRQDVIEKDYYVSMLLQELSRFQMDGLPAYFKGGTALYKALHSIRRFSEDVDLSVDIRGCSRTQGDKRLERATKKYTCMERNTDEGRTNRSEVISYYRYLPVVEYDTEDVLQRFGKVKVEATSFTISEPYEPVVIAPLLYEQATRDQQLILIQQFDVNPFEILTMTIERIFIDKLFAAEAYTRQAEQAHRAFEASKHIYDLAVILDEQRILSLLRDEKQLAKLLEIRLTEEKNRLDGIPGVLPKDFTFFDTACQNAHIKKAYETMQNQYVLIPDERIGLDKARSQLFNLKEKLCQNPAWNLAEIPESNEK